MKRLRLFLLVGIVAGALVASGRAQSVHLSFRGADESWLNFKANSALIPWNLSGGYFSRFDLYYDPGTALDLGDGTFRFTDPTRSLWRVTMHHYGELGTFEVVRPLASMTVWENGFFFEQIKLDGLWEELELTVEFEGGNMLPNTLPVPPFQITSNHVFVQAGRAFFDVPNLAEVYGAASFSDVTARVVDSVDLYPVPEPSTYALGGVVLIGAALVCSRRHRGRAAAPRQTKASKPS